MSAVPRTCIASCPECIPGTASNFLFKHFVAPPVASVITGMSTHFMSHTRFISVHKLLYFSLLAASFYVTLLSAGIATSIRMHGFSLFGLFLLLIVISGLFAVTSLSVCIP